MAVKLCKFAIDCQRAADCDRTNAHECEMTDVRRDPQIAGGGRRLLGKPLWQKLGLKAQMRVRLLHAPPEYWNWCDFDAASTDIVAARARAIDFAHVFATSRKTLESDLRKTRTSARKQAACLWISWPKKSSGVATDISEGTLREVALPLGLVDVKVCAVTEVWSGLKFVWRVDRRASLARKSS